jgi:hypothetical protein
MDRVLDNTCEALSSKRGRLSEEGDEASISLSSSASSRDLRIGIRPGMFVVATVMLVRVVGFEHASAAWRCELLRVTRWCRRAVKWKAHASLTHKPCDIEYIYNTKHLLNSPFDQTRFITKYICPVVAETDLLHTVSLPSQTPHSGINMHP